MRSCNAMRAPVLIAVSLALVMSASAGPAAGQTAVQAALDMANLLDGAGGGISRDEQMAALQDAAAAGQPIALWRLGIMYESGDGVKQDKVKAFSYFSKIVNDNANTPPRSLEADIVAQSFVKVGDYIRDGLPDAGIKANIVRSHGFLLHAATYFGDAEAQYRVGLLYLQKNELGVNPLQGARWLTLAARKGHTGAQAKLGELLFNGEGIEAQPIEGLMWMKVAEHKAVGTAVEADIKKELARALAVATADQVKKASLAAASLGPEYGGY